MLSRTNIASLLLLAIPALVGAQNFGIKTDAQAYYQGNNGGLQSHQVKFPAPTLPAVSESRSYVPVGGATSFGRADRISAYDDADAWVKITHPGIEQSYARVGGPTPQGGSPNGVFASTFAESYTKWMAVGPENQMVSVDLAYFLDGWLFAAKAAGTNASLGSQVNVVMRIDLGNGAGLEEIFFARGALWQSTGLSPFFRTKNGWSDSKWNSSWTDTTSTLTSPVGNDRMFDLDYADVIPGIFQVMSNTPFVLDYTVTVSAYNNAGLTDAFATADFSNTAGMDFTTTTPGFTMEEVGLVPEPSATVALALGVCGMCARRRRR